MNLSAFISYSSSDRQTADRVCSLLEEAGISCWIAPRDIKPGARWAEEIVSAIEKHDAAVILLSEKANASPVVVNEVDRAFSKGKRIFTFRIEKVEPGPALELYLCTSQWIDADKPPGDEPVKTLAEAIKKQPSAGKEERPPKQPEGRELLKNMREAVNTALGRMIIERKTDIGGVHILDKNGFVVWRELFAEHGREVTAGLVDCIWDPEVPTDSCWKAVKLLSFAMPRSAEGQAMAADLLNMLADHIAFSVPVLRDIALETFMNSPAVPDEKWQRLIRILPVATPASCWWILVSIGKVVSPATREQTGKAVLAMLPYLNDRHVVGACINLLSQLNFREGMDQIRDCLTVLPGDCIEGPCQLLADWACKDAVPQIRDAIRRAAVTDRYQREAVEGLYRLEESKCAPFIAEFLRDASDPVRSGFLDSGMRASGRYHEKPVLEVVEDLAKRSLNDEVRKKALQYLEWVNKS